MGGITIKLFEELTDEEAETVFDFSYRNKTHQFAVATRPEIDPGECAFLFDNNSKEIIGLFHVAKPKKPLTTITNPSNPLEIDDFRLCQKLSTTTIKELLKEILLESEKKLCRLSKNYNGIIIQPSKNFLSQYPEHIKQTIEEEKTIFYTTWDNNNKK